MVEIGHGHDACPCVGKNFEQQPVSVLVFRLQLLEQRKVIFPLAFAGLNKPGYVLEWPRDVSDSTLTAQFAFEHSVPIAGKAFVAGSLRP